MLSQNIAKLYFVVILLYAFFHFILEEMKGPFKNLPWKLGYAPAIIRSDQLAQFHWKALPNSPINPSENK